ncbi:MAG: DNA methyltransferase [Gemmataceae bacterium]
MPADPKPLFRPEAVQPLLEAFELPAAALAARPKLKRWATLLKTPQAAGLKETELRDEFIYDVFRDLLGYVSSVQDSDNYTLKKEAFIEADGTYADAGFGRFTPSESRFVAVLEGKGPNDPLDKPYKNRKRSAVEQAVLYALQLKLDWYLVSNLRETRLYCKRDDTAHFERFETARLATDDAEFKRFVFLLGAERVVGEKNHLDSLLVESKTIGRRLTAGYYQEYRTLRAKTFEALRQHNPGRDVRELLAAAQKILDRVLFISFCEDRDLLPRDIIARAYQHKDPFNPRPIWDNFKGLFASVDKGNTPLGVFAYNGGLFAADAFINSLTVPDDICEGFKKLAEYEYGFEYRPGTKLIDVEILGHIFEQSISDLEELHQQLDSPPSLLGKGAGGLASSHSPSKRKKEGAFYTPEFITRYIVAETLGPVVDARFKSLREKHQAKMKGTTARKLLDDPLNFDPKALNEPQRKALAEFWHAWIDVLETIRIVDPACGSGAFLIEAFDQMYAEYEEAQDCLKLLQGASLLDVQKTILTHNLFGMDLNGEAVEIARLSCWIKTAVKGKQLTTLDENIRQGNSVVGDPNALAHWRASFPTVFEAGGFDVVIGNPPYVRQEWIAPFKQHWKDTFECFDSIADLFVYFYELGVKIMRPGGRMGYITSGSWVRGNFGEALRNFLTCNAGLESMIDFGEYQPFEDAEMIRPTITILSKRAPGGPMKMYKWLTSGKPPEDLSALISDAPSVDTGNLGKQAWELESHAAIALRKKLSALGQGLGAYSEGRLYRGVLTGLTEVFVISDQTRNQLIREDANSAEIIKPFIQGSNLRPWHITMSGENLLAIKSSNDHAWPWSDAGQNAESIFAKSYPAIHAYLDGHRAAAIKRTDQGRFWWELRSCAYWHAFDEVKIVWPDITNRPRFSMDLEKRYLGNTGYIIPGEDYFLLGVLASWATWFFISKTAQPLRLRSDRWQYRLIAQFMEHVPIPSAKPVDREKIAELARACNQLGGKRYSVECAVQHRLLQSFGTSSTGESLGKLNEKSQEWWEQSLQVLGGELKKSFKLSRSPFSNPKTADDWEPYLKEKKIEVDGLRQKLADAEAEINERVYRLFNLTPDEIKLLQREVEH